MIYTSYKNLFIFLFISCSFYAQTKVNKNHLQKTNSLTDEVLIIGQEQMHDFPEGSNYKSLKDYSIFLPNGYDEAISCPLYIHMHGRNGGNKPNPEDFLLRYGAFKNKMYTPTSPFIIARPRTDTWNEADRTKFLNYLIDTYKVDTDRIHVSGYSAGGYSSLAWLINELQAGRNTFASVSPVAAATSLDYNVMAEAPNVPVWFFHGDLDTTVNSNKVKLITDQLVRFGSDVKLSIAAGFKHNTWDQPFKEQAYIDWLVASKKREPTVKVNKSISVNFCSSLENLQIVSSNVTAGIANLGTNVSYWNNITENTVETESLMTGDGEISDLQLSINAPNGFINCSGLSASFFQSGIKAGKSNTSFTLSGIENNFSNSFHVIVYFTGERSQFNYLSDESGNPIFKNNTQNQLFEKTNDETIAATISDASTTYYYKLPSVYGGNNFKKKYPYTLIEALETAAPAEHFKEATYAVFGPYNSSSSSLTFTVDNLEGGYSAIAGFQIVSSDELLAVKSNSERILSRFYPNPFRDYVKVESDMWGLVAQIIDMTGGIIHTEKLEDILNLSFLSNGLYFIKVQGFEPIKIVKQ